MVEVIKVVLCTAVFSSNNNCVEVLEPTSLHTCIYSRAASDANKPLHTGKNYQVSAESPN